MLQLLVILMLLTLGFLAGNYLEQRHYTSIKQRERGTARLRVVNIGAKQPLPDAKEAQMFAGSVVISSDYFKTFVAGWLQVFGGQIVVYDSLLDRGRREAMLRMKEQALSWGAKQVVNVRLETATIGNAVSNKGIVSIEVIAYGTGLR